MRWRNRLRILAFGLLGVSSLSSGQICGDVAADAGNYGPFDYRDAFARAERLNLVERAHFTRAVESLVSGATAATPGHDIDYTLRKFPNHHRALAAMGRLFARQGGDRPPGVRYSMNCWFQRARQFAPEDGMVPMIEGMYLQEMGYENRALKKLEHAASIEPSNANIRYNLGIAYAARGDLDNALEQAKAAYGTGFPLPGLKNMLAAQGLWPPPQE